jgi:hypothetical protein
MREAKAKTIHTIKKTPLRISQTFENPRGLMAYLHAIL